MVAHRPAPLTGITVLEVGVFMAAPFATMQLADLGARVIKVENPEDGDPTRQTGPFVDGESSPFLRMNRNKRSVALDLKAEGGREAFLRLAEHSDVLVENLRPGAMRRLGLDLAPVHERNPRLVYASVSGWGQDGPLAGLPGLDIMAQARAGLMSVTGTSDSGPAKMGVPVCDLVSGLYTALAVTSALHERGPDGDGQYIDVSLMESAVSLAVWEAGRYFATGEVGGRLGSAHQSAAPYQALRTADGHITVGAITANTWRGLCAVLNLDLADDPRYTTAYGRNEHRDGLIPVIGAATAQWPTKALVDALNDAGVPCAPISDYGGVFTDAHLAARDYFWDAPHPEVGPVRQLGSPMRFGSTPVSREEAGPSLGAHTRSVLSEIGLSGTEIEELLVSREARGTAAEGSRS
ncbi:CaiB/BaiF CoA transferase family protein [Allosalinactinospora lopnorensis]|uniref:CaiB/BaiF CoA transferase family protein n=1 Tax=Allosalinactinospora lopnorensis TaxID=1352348 RepID=UPI000623BD26|nr:CoA transferase [Allosalinactinospora lopnorensis]